METNQLQTQPQNKVALTSNLISSQPSVKALIELPAIEENWIKTYRLVTGREDGAMKFNAEKVLFLKTIAENDTLSKADKFSIYTAFTELAISGGTLRDGICYIVPFKGKAQFMPGWKFRLEQVNELPNVVFCNEPQVVYDCDAFQYEKGERVRIHKHMPGNRTPESRILFVYWVIQFTHGKEVYIMEAADVYKAREKSQTFKFYERDIKAQGGKIGDKVKKNGSNGSYEMDLPFWVSDEAEAFKKTIVKRVWKNLPKLPKHKVLEDRIQKAGAVEVDPEEIQGQDLEAKLQDVVLNIEAESDILEVQEVGSGSEEGF